MQAKSGCKVQGGGRKKPSTSLLGKTTRAQLHLTRLQKLPGGCLASASGRTLALLVRSGWVRIRASEAVSCAALLITLTQAGSPALPRGLGESEVTDAGPAVLAGRPCGSGDQAWLSRKVTCLRLHRASAEPAGQGSGACTPKKPPAEVFLIKEPTRRQTSLSRPSVAFQVSILNRKEIPAGSGQGPIYFSPVSSVAGLWRAH